MLTVYVDYLIIIGDVHVEISKLKKQLKSIFEIRDLGFLRSF